MWTVNTTLKTKHNWDTHVTRGPWLRQPHTWRNRLTFKHDSWPSRTATRNKETKQENKHTKIKEHSPKKQQKCKAVMGKQVAKIKKNMMWHCEAWNKQDFLKCAWSTSMCSWYLGRNEQPANQLLSRNLLRKYKEQTACAGCMTLQWSNQAQWTKKNSSNRFKQNTCQCALRCFPEGCFNNLLWSGLAFCLFSAKEANTFTRLHWAFKWFFVLDPIHIFLHFQMCFAKITNENTTRWHPHQDRWQKRVTSTSARPSDWSCFVHCNQTHNFHWNLHPKSLTGTAKQKKTHQHPNFEGPLWNYPELLKRFGTAPEPAPQEIPLPKPLKSSQWIAMICIY